MKYEVSSQVKVTPPTIVWGGYVALKNEAKELLEAMQSVEVTEDSIASNKKLVAEVRKKAELIDSERKGVKNEVNNPLKEYENQVKEVLAIIKEAENQVRAQLSTYEQSRQDSKREALHLLWSRRVGKFGDVDSFVSFEDWLDNKHLTKTLSISRCEEDMVNFLQSSKEDIATINALPNTEDVLMYYSDGKTLQESIQLAKKREEQQEKIRDIRPISKQLTSFEANVKLYKQTDYNLVIAFCEQNNIKYN
ncbi:gp29 [Listeria phage P40]|uniref:gp29 n=1 Tax=Listeria phage P40 TaxID=560178 RepID=UPI00018198E3|nr:gp29 [Listeria phage P40]ACI00389.1 gp29 [Listeria phage P40]